MQGMLSEIEKYNSVKIYGQVKAVKGLLMEVVGINKYIAIGSRCRIHCKNKKILAEVISLKDEVAYLQPFTSTEGVGIGNDVEIVSEYQFVYPDISWLGRVVNGIAEPLDNHGELIKGNKSYNVKAQPPPANTRNRIGDKIDTGVSVINTFITCCVGQRMGIFAGSGIGKSLLVAMLAKYAVTDVKVIGLIGERGKEVKEFIEDYMTPEDLQRTVIVVATSDESPLMIKQAASLTMTIAEYFRDIGKNVLCVMDSITRFAQAQRQIGLSVGEPPTTKGFTPTVFSELPKLLERAGPGNKDAAITGLFTVLVEGDDHNEPISDAVRAILDGHIVLDRKIAEEGRFPAVDVLKSVSRALPGCHTKEESEIIKDAKKIISTYQDMEDLIKLGAYKKGSNEEVDRAIEIYPKIMERLNQPLDVRSSLEKDFLDLKELVGKEMHNE